MNTYIVNESSKNIRMLARQNLKGQWKSAVITMLIFFLCIIVPVIIITAIFGGFSEEALMSEDIMMPGEGLSTIYSLLVEGAFTFGITVFFLDLVREKKTDMGLVFSGFNYYFKTLLLYVVMSIFIMLWTLLFIIPGIIAAFRYSQAFYILADDPSKDIMQCINESKEMMKGNKAKYFYLGLSFIGWFLLIYGVFMVCTIVSVTLSIMIPLDAVSIVIMGIGAIAMIAGAIFLLVYMQTAYTIFYEMVNGNLRQATNELPPLSQAAPEEATPAQNAPVELPPLSQAAPDDVTPVQKVTEEAPQIAPEVEKIEQTVPEINLDMKVDEKSDSVNVDKIEF